ncbi:MAG: DNA repair protein RecO [Kiloniellales bacterium]|nr:DNA repair protein RecO [Kiloniellales bacterium]
MHWTDEGIVLSARPHGESAVVVVLLSRDHGRHAGLLHGGQGRKGRGLLEPGTRVAAEWRARLAEHLGSFTLELIESHAAGLLDDAARLNALTAAAAVCDKAFPEREPHPAAYEGLRALLTALEGEHWAEAYVVWELAVLRELGFGLDLSACAGGGANDQLAYVSPKSGRAVSLAAGEPYKDRLLPLPGFLTGQGGGGPAEVAQGLKLTGFFLARRVFGPQNQPLPPARERLAERFGGGASP